MFVNRIKNFIKSLEKHPYFIRIKLPYDSTPEYWVKSIRTIKGIDNTWLIETDIIALVEWRKKDIDKRIRSLYLKLPDFSLIELEEI